MNCREGNRDGSPLCLGRVMPETLNPNGRPHGGRIPDGELKRRSKGIGPRRVEEIPPFRVLPNPLKGTP